MELTELVRTRRTLPERTWNIASSKHWYDGDDFWMEMITNDPVYRAAMIETETQLISELCKELQGAQQEGTFVALGPGDGEKEIALCKALGAQLYVPIDINEKELEIATRSSPVQVKPLRAEFREGLRLIQDAGSKFIYLGSTYSNLAAFDYDLLATIDESMRKGDRAYLSVQAFPIQRDEPLLYHQYHNVQYLSLNRRMISSIGAEAGKPFVQLDTLTRNLNIGATIDSVSGTAEEIGMRAGDRVITMISHKPQSLLPELKARFAKRYNIYVYKTQREVPTPSGNYTSTFEGAVLTKL